MNYKAKATVEYRERLTPANSPSQEKYGEWQIEAREIQAVSYFDLVNQLEKIYAEYPNGTFAVEDVSPENGGKFSDLGMKSLYADIDKFNERRFT